jgi:hypothetical protein
MSIRTPEEWHKISDRWMTVAVFSAGAVTGLTIARIMLLVYVANGWPIR